MSEPKPLKEHKLQNLANQELKKSTILINHEKETFINIPTSVLKTLDKINTSLVHADILSHALLLRSKAQDNDQIQNWIELTYNQSKYPLTHSNTVFSKFIRSIFESLELKGYLSEKEIRDIIHFFARCPHGYTIPMGLIKSHNEIQARFT